MSNPKISEEAMYQAVSAVQAALDVGYRLTGMPSAIGEAARTLKMEPNTLRHRVRVARRHGYALIEPELEPAQPPGPPPVEVKEKPRIRIRVHSAGGSPTYRVLALGDAHDGPNLPNKARFKWIGRHAAAMKPDYVVQIGDFASFDSLSRHEVPGGAKQKVRPSYQNDLESLEEAVAAFFKEYDGDNLHTTLGNHEKRVLRFEESVAELEGCLWAPLMDLFGRYRWRTHDEGEFLFIGAVGFVHAPRTLMNREYGGKTLNAILNDAVFSFAFGHSHRGQVVHAPKIGPAEGVTVVNLGTCLPTGYVAEYAKVATTGWTYGVYELTLCGGKIAGHQFIPMDELERRYRD